MRIGIIGCGGISAVHAGSIAESARGELIAAADIRPERAEKMAKNYGCRAYTDWQEMLEKEVPDVVHICTPHYLHTPMAVKCLEKGIHVFAEKPPVISYSQLQELQTCYENARESKGLRLGVCFQNRLNPESMYVKQVIESGEMGAVLGGRGFVTWNRSKEYYSDGWHGVLAYEGGGALINQGIHTMDLLQFFIGEKVDFVGAMKNNFHLQGEIQVEDTLCAYMKYPGAVANLYITTGYVADSAPIIEIQLEKGSLRMESGQVIKTLKSAVPEVISFEDEKALGKTYWGAGHRKAIEGFYESILSGSANILDFENTMDSLQLMLDIYSACEK